MARKLCRRRRVPVPKDIRKQCHFCKGRFTWKVAEQQWYRLHNFPPPRRCPKCRAREELTGVRLDRPCTDCGQPAHKSTLGRRAKWPVRCARCRDLRAYPKITRRRVNAGDAIPATIYNDLFPEHDDE